MQALRKLAAARGQSISSVANEILAAHFSEGRRRRQPFRQETHSLGARPGINFHKSLELAAAIDIDDALEGNAKDTSSTSP